MAWEHYWFPKQTQKLKVCHKNSSREKKVELHRTRNPFKEKTDWKNGQIWLRVSGESQKNM